MEIVAHAGRSRTETILRLTVSTTMGSGSPLPLWAVLLEYWHGYKDGELSREQFDIGCLRWASASIPCCSARSRGRGEHSAAVRLVRACADILAHKGALWTRPVCGESECRTAFLGDWRFPTTGTSS